MTAVRVSLIGIAAVGAVASLVAWRRSVPHGRVTAPHIAIIRDRSDSTTSGCGALGSLVSLALEAPGLTKDSALIGIATGDRSTAGEPTELFRKSGLTSTRVMESAKSRKRRGAQIVAETVARCETLQPAETTPLLLAIRRAVEALRAAGCREDSRCELLIQSDGAETAEPVVRRALAGTSKPGALPAPIDNRGITISFYGIAETKGPADSPRRVPPGPHALHDSKHADRVVAVWKRLFTDSSAVTFAPHCPTPTPVLGTLATGLAATR